MDSILYLCYTLKHQRTHDIDRSCSKSSILCFNFYICVSYRTKSLIYVRFR